MVKRSREDFDLLNTGESLSASPPSSSTLILDSRPSSHETSKIVHIDIEGGEASQNLTEVMRCSLPPHRQILSFTSFEEYEVHYNKIHLNRCSECRKNFPTAFFLDLHISENHDPLVDVLKNRGERTYACFVEDCNRKCSSPNKRRMHLIDKHIFPKDYDFNMVNDGIDQRSSMLRSRRHRRQNSTAQHRIDIDERVRRRSSTLSKMDLDNKTAENSEDRETVDTSRTQDSEKVDPEQKDAEMEGLVGAMSSLKFVPLSVRFGRGRGKGGFSKT